MRTASKERFCNILYAIRRGTQRNLILILDNDSVKLISCLLQMKDLIDLGISLIEKIELQRKEFPKHDAIYFINTKSLPQLVKDLQSKQYRKSYIFFLNKFTEIQTLAPHINSIKELKELNHLCLFVDENTFYGVPDINQLCNTSICFAPFNFVRVSTNCSLAQSLADTLPSLIRKWEDQKYINLAEGELHFMILERSFDNLTPLLHDFHYQSLLQDLEIQYNAEDEVFQRYRYRHIAEALEGLPAEFRNMVENNPSAKLHKGEMQDLDYNKMQQIMATMPNYNNQLKYFTYHMQLIDQIWKIFETSNLKDIGDLEQALATGTNKDGSQTKSEQVYNDVLLMLQSKIIKDADKTRLVLICLLCIQLPEQQRQELISKLPEQLKLQNFISFDQKSNKITKNISAETRMRAKQKLSQMTLDLQRHTCLMERMLNDLLEDQWKFSTVNIFGTQNQVVQTNSLKKQAPQVQKINVCIYVNGGLSNAEIAALRNYQHPKLQNLYLGSNKIYSPNEFVALLK